MNEDTSFDGGCFAGAVSRLGRLADASNRINTDLAVLPDDMKQDENDTKVSAIYESVLGELSIPLNVYCDSYPALSQADTKLLMRSMRKWSAGKMSRREVMDFLEDISESADLDWCYAFSGIPIRELSPKEQQELLVPIVKFGSRSH
jgi:hypothetical protein